MVYYNLKSESHNHPMMWPFKHVDNSKLTTISSLETNKTYVISVLAKTSIGDGPLSEKVEVKTQQGRKYLNEN